MKNRGGNMMTHGVSSLLISAAAGYWVLAQSGGQKGRVKQLGQFLGLLIIVVSVVGASCKLYCLWGGPSAGGFPMRCSVMGKQSP